MCKIPFAIRFILLANHPRLFKIVLPCNVNSYRARVILKVRLKSSTATFYEVVEDEQFELKRSHYFAERGPSAFERFGKRSL